MWRSIQRSLIIALLGAMIGLLVNAVRRDSDQNGNPRRIPLVAPPLPPVTPKDNIPPQEARQLWETGTVVFLDARPAVQYAEGHIANALSLPSEAFNEEFPKILPFLSADSVVVVYCDGEQCELSHEVQDKMRKLGFPNVRVLVNGWTTWRKAGWPIATGAPS